MRHDSAMIGGQRFGRRARRSPSARCAIALEERRARRHPVLDHFVQPGAELAPRQRAEHRRIDDDGVRLVEGADQVLAERMVDADLAADRAVHLRQQRRRHVHERDAAQVGRRGEARHVADDAAAERDERRRAIGVRADQRVVDARDGRELLVALAVGDEDRLPACRCVERARARSPWSRQTSGLETTKRRPGARASSSARPTRSSDAVADWRSCSARRRRDVDARPDRGATGC